MSKKHNNSAYDKLDKFNKSLKARGIVIRNISYTIGFQQNLLAN